MWQQKSLKAFQFSWELSFCWQQESHLNNAAFQENVQAVHSRTALHYNATDFHWGGETYRIQLLKKNTCWIFGGNKDVWEKKQDVAAQITDICQEFVALFTDFFCPLGAT